MNAAPAVSVIVCTHDRAGYLPACLRSLAQQDCESSFEVLVVDNGSRDETWQVLTEWCAQDSRFRAIQEPRLGLSIAKNRGVRHALGRLLLFTDDDVIVDRQWIRGYEEFFRRIPGEFVIAGGPIVPVPHDLQAWPRWFDHHAIRDVGLLDYGEERPLRPTEYVWGANMAIPAAHFCRTGLWDERVGRQGEKRGTFEDTEYQDRVREMGGGVWFCPASTLQHRILRETISPSRILRTTFAKARNEFWAQVVQQRQEGRFAPRHDYVRSLAVLAAGLTAFGLWSLAFTFCHTSFVFSRAHSAAASSGRAVDLLRAGRESTRLSAAIGHSSFFVLDSVLSLVRLAGERRG